MGKMIKGIHVKGKRVIGKKPYKWYIPKALDGKIEKGDIVLVRVGEGENETLCPVLVVGIFQSDKLQHKQVVRILSENSKNVIDNKLSKKEEVAKKRGKFSDEEKEQIKMCRAEGKTLKVIAEMYSCSISTIHKIIKS